MSYWVADVGKIKIKPELRQEFYYLFHEEYDKITDPVLKEFAESFDDDENRIYSYPLNKWEHDDEKPEWVGKYSTFYDGEIFSYGMSYNQNGSYREFMQEFRDDIIPYVAEVILESDWWAEPW